MKIVLKSRAAFCAALLVSGFTLADDIVISRQGLSAVCVPGKDLVALTIKSDDGNASLLIESAGGNRLSSTLHSGSVVRYQMDSAQFPVTINYRVGSKESRFVLPADCDAFMQTK